MQDLSIVQGSVIIFTKMKAAKVQIKLFINITANIALFLLYAYLFGEQSVDKYLDKGVSIITQEETPLAITPPGNG